MNMKTISVTILGITAAAGVASARIGDDETQIEARYGKPGKDLGTQGGLHEVGYMANGFMILVDFVNGISQREGFANPDTSALKPEAVEQILIMSAVEGTKWQELSGAQAGDRSWRRSDGKVVAVFPTRGTFLFVQDVNFVQPK
jgi:hypothetical protein